MSPRPVLINDGKSWRLGRRGTPLRSYSVTAARAGGTVGAWAGSSHSYPRTRSGVSCWSAVSGWLGPFTSAHESGRKQEMILG